MPTPDCATTPIQTPLPLAAVSAALPEPAASSSTVTTSTTAQSIANIQAELATLRNAIKDLKSTQAVTVSGNLSPLSATLFTTPVTRVISSGVSRDDLSGLENSLRAEIARVASSATTQSAGNFAAIALTQRIDNLANVSIAGATISGANITGSTFSGSIGGTTGAFTGDLSVAGNVGIGTTSPSAPFSVAGNTYFASTVGIGTITPLANLEIASADSSSIVIHDITAGKALRMLSTGGVNYIQSGNYNSAGANADLSFSQMYGTAPYIYIKSASTGFVGIGTAAPLSRLGVLGNASIGASYGAIAAPTSGMIVEGDVGIGTTSPFSKLSVTTAAQQVGTLPLFTVASTTNASLFTVLGNGNVGIGTVSPQSQLHVFQAAGSKIIIGGTADTGQSLDFDNSTNGSSVRFRIGYIGGNSTRFSSPLSSVNFMDFSGNGNAVTIYPNTAIQGSLLTLGAQGVGGTPATGATIAVNGIDGTPDNLAGGNLTLQSGQGTGNATAGDIIFQTADVGTSGGTLQATSTKLTIKANGNVGIGSTTPWGQLSVNPNGITGPAFVVGSSTATNFIVTNSGNVGIGTSSSAANLSIANNSTAQLLYLSSTQSPYMTFDNGIASPNQALYDVGMSGNSFLIRDNDASKTPLAIGDGGISLTLNAFNNDSSNANIIFQTNNGTERMRINGSGNVGIGTTSPWRKLSVTGTVGFDGIAGSTGSGSLCLDANKQVVFNSGSDACLSSTRATKHDISTLTLSGTSTVSALEPVSFIYNNDASSTVRFGFIAEDAAAVDEHFATHDTTGAISGIDDRSIIAILVKAVQELIAEVNSFAASITTNVLTAVTGTFTSVNTDNICVKKSDGSNVCITGDELNSILNQGGTQPLQATSGSSMPAASADISTSTAITTSATTTTDILAPMPSADSASTTSPAVPPSDSGSMTPALTGN